MRNCTLFRAKSHAVAIETSCDCVNRNACCLFPLLFFNVSRFLCHYWLEELKKKKEKKIERAIADQLIDPRFLGTHDCVIKHHKYFLLYFRYKYF